MSHLLISRKRKRNSSKMWSPTTNLHADSCMQFVDRVGLVDAAANGLNFVFSPLSIRAALSLAAAGAKGPTLDEFLSFLGFSTIDDLNSATKNLLEAVQIMRGGHNNEIQKKKKKDADRRRCGGSHLSFAHGVWVDRSMALKPSFKEVAASVYDAEANSVDFKNQASEARREVNAWIRNKTNGLIEDLIPRDAVKRDTKIILANALYFKGKWDEKFNSSLTKARKFYLLDGTSIRAPFMSSHNDQFVASFKGFKVLELSYRQNEVGMKLSMLIVLPNERYGLNDLVRMAVSDSSFWNDHIPTKLVKVGDFRIPKFKISSMFEASEALQELGLKIPFSAKDADFSGMVTNLVPLYISQVLHKSTIEVEEQGTEASASTAILVFASCASNYKPPPRVDFVANHPFIFAIREKDTGCVLFLGHVANPSI